MTWIFKKLISLKESQTREFKRNASSLDGILKTLIAFANTTGGVLLIGVEDNGDICGIAHPEKILEKIANSLTNRIKPQQLMPEFNFEEIEGKAVLVIQVEPESIGPYFLSDKGEEKGVFRRVGNTNQQASPEFIAEAKRANQTISFDSKVCTDVDELELNQSFIAQSLSHKEIIINTEKLLSLGILTKKGHKVFASNGGLILFGNDSVREQYFPYAKVRCARFAGNAKVDFIDRLDIDGSILNAINEVPKFIRRNTKMAGLFGEMRRRDVPEYPVAGIREALVNALAHANYEIMGTPISIAIFDDRLELTNPGIMPPGMNIEQFKAGVSRVRNHVIARIFREMNLIETWGSGYKRIKDACEQGGYPEPDWVELGTVLRVIFYPHPEVKRLGANLVPEPAPSWNQVDRVTVELLQVCKKPTRIHDVMVIWGLSDRTKFRKKYLNPLLDAGFLKMTIPDKPTSSKQHYILTEQGLCYLDELEQNGLIMRQSDE